MLLTERGSRVTLVIDDVPILTPERNEILWDFVPLETTDQIEVVKGSSSVQYGSSALNGIVHARTRWPERNSKAQTRIRPFQPSMTRRIRRIIVLPNGGKHQTPVTVFKAFLIPSDFHTTMANTTPNETSM